MKLSIGHTFCFDFCIFQANEFRYDKAAFEQHAREWTLKHANQSTASLQTTSSAQNETETGNSSENESDSDSEDSDASDTENRTKTKVVGTKRTSNPEHGSVLQENVKKMKS